MYEVDKHVSSESVSDRAYGVAKHRSGTLRKGVLAADADHVVRGTAESDSDASAGERKAEQAHLSEMDEGGHYSSDDSDTGISDWHSMSPASQNADSHDSDDADADDDANYSYDADADTDDDCRQDSNYLVLPEQDEESPIRVMNLHSSHEDLPKFEGAYDTAMVDEVSDLQHHTDFVATDEKSNYLEYMPHPMDAGFQGYISSKKEFIDFSSSSSGDPMFPGEYYFKYQQLFRLYMCHFDRLILISEPGTGKSCNVVSFWDYVLQCKEGRNSASMDSTYLSHLKKCIIVVNSDTQGTNIKNEIMKANGGKLLKDSASVNSLLAANKYEKKTYQRFASILKGTKWDSNMWSAWEDGLIWFDEVHNITNCNSSAKNNNEKESYKSYHALLHGLKRCKIVLSTATPMINSPAEMVQLLNLVAPQNGRPPPDWDWTVTDMHTFQTRFPSVPLVAQRALAESKVYKDWTCTKVKKYFKGQVTKSMITKLVALHSCVPPSSGAPADQAVAAADVYMRGLFFYTRKSKCDLQLIDVGNPLVYENTQYSTIVCSSSMSKHQEDGYLKYKTELTDNSFYIQNR